MPPRRQCRLRDRSEELGGQQLCRVVANYPTIARVYFNGATAAELYRRLAEERDWPLHYQRLPSTSLAHVMRPGAKLAAWQAIPRRLRARRRRAKRVGASEMGVMTPAVAGGPTVLRLRSARTTTTASLRRTAGRRAAPRSASRRPSKSRGTAAAGCPVRFLICGREPAALPAAASTPHPGVDMHRHGTDPPRRPV